MLRILSKRQSVSKDPHLHLLPAINSVDVIVFLPLAVGWPLGGPVRLVERR